MVRAAGKIKLRLGIVLCAVAVVGCGGDVPSADAEHFQGLDPAVVTEVLTNPIARQKIEEEPSPTRESMAQGIVINFILCRDAFRVYREWINTGSPPDLARPPVPTRPREPSSSDLESYYALFEDAIDSGELERLRFVLTAEGSCGRWIPAVPGDSSGPTIMDAIEAGP
jgi:hypothetical protein